MKTKILLSIFALFALLVTARAQVTNFSLIILSGAGTAAVNGNWSLVSGSPGPGYASGYYTNGNPSMGFIGQQNFPPFAWEQNYYNSTNFPYVWKINTGIIGATNPPPSGNYSVFSVPVFVAWQFGMTNFFTVPNDAVLFSGSGRNMATNANMASLEILVDSNIVYLSTTNAGYGSSFDFNGRLQWDGTNLYAWANMDSGDPSNVQAFQTYSYSNYRIGTNWLQFVSLGNTNSLVFLQGQINATRAPAGNYSPASTTIIQPGSATLQ